MESVHQQRQRAQAAYDLIDYYGQFAKDDTTRVDALKKEGKEGRRKVAVLLRRLATVAKEVDLSHSDKVGVLVATDECVSDTQSSRQTRENIDRYCEKFEKDMLHLFDRAYRRGDPKMMHVRAFDTACTAQFTYACTTALRANSPRLQRGRVLCASICQPTRLLH